MRKTAEDSEAQTIRQLVLPFGRYLEAPLPSLLPSVPRHACRLRERRLILNKLLKPQTPSAEIRLARLNLVAYGYGCCHVKQLDLRILCFRRNAYPAAVFLDHDQPFMFAKACQTISKGSLDRPRIALRNRELSFSTRKQTDQ